MHVCIFETESCCVAQPGLKLTVILLAYASQILRLQVCDTMPGLLHIF